MGYAMFSSLSPQETYRMYGKVTRQQLEDLLEIGTKVDSGIATDVAGKIDEGMCQLPAEDFLEGVKGRLHELAKRLRSDNKAEVIAIIEVLDDIAQTTFNASDYARSELNDALKMLEALQ